MAKSSWLTSWIGQMHGTHPPRLQRMLPIRKPFEREPAGEPLACQAHLSTSRDKFSKQFALNLCMQGCLRLDEMANKLDRFFRHACHVMQAQAYMLLYKHFCTCSRHTVELHWKHLDAVQTCTLKGMHALPLARCGSTKITDISASQSKNISSKTACAALLLP